MPESPSTTRFFDARSVSAKILVREWPAVGEERGEVLLLHGLGDHSGRHAWAASLISGAGYRVVSFDWPGNGQSDGVRGDMPRIPEASALLEEIVGGLGLCPNGIMGHSTGAFLLLQWLTCGDPELPSLPALRWVWLSSPLLVPSHGQPRIKVALANLLARRFPRMTLGTGVHVRDCYHTGLDPMAESALVRAGGHHRVSLRFATSLLEEEGRILSRAAGLRDDLGLLLTQGGDDRICPPEYASALFARLTMRDKVYLYDAAARHEPFREPEPEAITNAVRRWISGRVALMEGSDRRR